ncbi:MAG: SDR family oxidoreductase [Bacteroidetes bacterium]|nr:SDR family oxidoreductase [Bacteroidota bacterium]
MEFFKNKVAVVTGGSEGIGRAIVLALLRQGCKVATCARNYDKLYALKSSNPDEHSLFIYAADVSNEMDCAHFFEKTIQQFGTIHILVNNAGISMRGLFLETNLDTFRKLMEVNFWGNLYCAKLALPYIIKNKGSLVGISSIAGFRGLPGRSGYSASKFAINGWMEALRTELMETGVNVLTVCPGFTASNIRNAALTEDGKPQGSSPLEEQELMTADECAEYIVEAIEKHKRTLILTGTGKRTVILNRFFPTLTDKLTRKYYFKNGRLVK